MRSPFAVAAFGIPLLSLGSSGTALAAQSKDCGVFMPCAAMKADTAETTTPAAASTRISRRSAAVRPTGEATRPVVSGRSAAVTTEGPAVARTRVIGQRSALRTTAPAPASTTVQTGYGYQPQPWGWDNYQRPIATAPVVTGRSIAAIPAAPAVTAAPAPAVIAAAPAYTTGYAYQPQPWGWDNYQTPVTNAPVVTGRSVGVTPAVVAAPAPAYTTGYAYQPQPWGWGYSRSPWWW